MGRDVSSGTRGGEAGGPAPFVSWTRDELVAIVALRLGHHHDARGAAVHLEARIPASYDAGAARVAFRSLRVVAGAYVCQLLDLDESGHTALGVCVFPLERGELSAKRLSDTGLLRVAYACDPRRARQMPGQRFRQLAASVL